jgi:hypothetical protein
MMIRNLIIIPVVVLAVFLILPRIYAEGDPMYQFYNGLAEVIERNMEHPEDCAAKAEIFIRDNIDQLRQAVQRSKEVAKNTQNSQMSEVELQKKTEELVRSRGFQAMSRFMGAFQVFGSKSPEDAQKIMAVMGEYETRFE